jgi:hypothetical protein
MKSRIATAVVILIMFTSTTHAVKCKWITIKSMTTKPLRIHQCIWTYVMYIYRPNRNNANSVSYNEIKDNRYGYYTYGLYTYYFEGKVNNNVITNNWLEKASGTPYGYQYTMMNYYFYNLQVNNNIIANNLGYYGSYPMYLYSFNSGSYKLEVRDNTIWVNGKIKDYNYQYNYNYTYIFTHITTTRLR